MMRRRFGLVAAALLAAGPPAGAAQLSGITMPDTQDVAGAHLVLNGLALRTYSFLGLRIYVAGLYLARRTANPDEIIDSEQPKLLRFTFTRDVAQWAARRSWRESLQNNCHAPCVLPAALVDQFLARVPAMHAGDTSTFLFTGSGLGVTLNGRDMGKVEDAAFTRLLLSTFIGAHPTAPDVKRELLGLPG